MSFRSAFPGLGGGQLRAWLGRAGTEEADMVSTFTIAGPSALAEGNSGATVFAFTVTRTGAVSAGGQVQWAVTGSGGNPANAADFVGGVLPSGTLVFAPGQASGTINVQVAGDASVEPDEAFSVTLSNARNDAIIGVPASAVATITNDDGAAADFSLSNAAVTTTWGRVAVGDLVPTGAPAGAYFVLVDEPAGFAVENG